MSHWDLYASRLGNSCIDKGGRTRTLSREQRFLRDHLPQSLSYHRLELDGEEREMAVINSDNLDTKRLCTKCGEDFRCGGHVEWADCHWLITERDANSELYTRGVMRQCNYQLRWLNSDGKFVERWCIVEDGTKYLTGEFGDRDFMMMRGDTRVSLTIAKDEETAKLTRNSRFLIGDYDSSVVMAYRLTKPLKVGHNYGDDGIYIFVLQECNTEDTDDLVHHIPDYYKFFPNEPIPELPPEEIQPDPGTDPETGGGGEVPDPGADPEQPPPVEPETPPNQDDSDGKKVWF